MVQQGRSVSLCRWHARGPIVFGFSGRSLRARAALHLETIARLLILLRRSSAVFSKYALKSLNNQADPPFGGSIPPAPATHSGVRPGSRRDARMGRKSRLFAHSLSSPDSRFAGHEAEIAKSLRPFPRIFPFWGDFRWRRVRSGLPPEDGSPTSRTDKASNKS